MQSATKKCQTCTKRLPREGPPCCAGRCKELYDKRRATRRAKPEHKEYMRRWFQGDAGKAIKKKSAAKFNATEKGKAVKRRSDKKYYSTSNGNIRVRMQRRFREIMDVAANGRSGKLAKYTTLCTTESITQWARQFGTPEENKLKHIDHTIPCAAYAWEWQNEQCDTLVRAVVTDEDMKRMWHADNLTMMNGVANMEKGCTIPDDATLMKLQHCWPSYWKDLVPNEEAKKKLAHASRSNVRVLKFKAIT